jgi:hypothetical protein
MILLSPAAAAAAARAKTVTWLRLPGAGATVFSEPESRRVKAPVVLRLAGAGHGSPPAVRGGRGFKCGQ